MLPFAEVSDRAGAIFSECRTYRYVLWRKWQRLHNPAPGIIVVSGVLPELAKPESGYLLWVMANPSTADAYKNDPTVKRTLDFADRWGYAEEQVCNAFAFRSTDPRKLRHVDDPVGPDNEWRVKLAAEHAHRIVLAWGNIGRINGQADRVREWLKPFADKVFCLGTTERHGEPCHPLYLPATTPLISFDLLED